MYLHIYILYTYTYHHGIAIRKVSFILIFFMDESEYGPIPTVPGRPTESFCRGKSVSLQDFLPQATIFHISPLQYSPSPTTKSKKQSLHNDRGFVSCLSPPQLQSGVQGCSQQRPAGFPHIHGTLGPTVADSQSHD